MDSTGISYRKKVPKQKHVLERRDPVHYAGSSSGERSKSSQSSWQVLAVLYLAVLFISLAVWTVKSSYIIVESPTHPSSLKILQSIREQSIEELSALMDQGRISSVDLVQTYLNRIDEVNSKVNAVCEINRDALKNAQLLDVERAETGPRGILHGIPILLKDTISAADMNNTAGSFCLVGSTTKNEASAISRLRKAGVIILGKTNLSQWGNARSSAKTQSNGWSAWGGQTYGVYHKAQDPRGSSSGSAVSMALGLAAASIGVETVGSIMCPAAKSNLVAIKPTAGLIARDNIIVTRLRGTPGPISHRVKDAAILLEAMAGPSDRDLLTSNVPFLIMPKYSEACRAQGLYGSRIGVPRNGFHNPFATETNMFLEPVLRSFEQALNVMRERGATIIEDTNYSSYDEINDNGPQGTVGLSEYKYDMVQYFTGLVDNPRDIHSLDDMITCTQNHPKEEYISRDTEYWERARNAPDLKSTEVTAAVQRMFFLARERGIDAALQAGKADALVLPTLLGADMPGMAGYPMITVPLGFMPPTTPIIKNRRDNLIWEGPDTPYGIAFVGTAWSEEKLIELAYSFEQATQYGASGVPNGLPTSELQGFTGDR